MNLIARKNPKKYKTGYYTKASPTIETKFKYQFCVISRENIADDGMCYPLKSCIVDYYDLQIK
jgi:hypothetical protein